MVNRETQRRHGAIKAVDKIYFNYIPERKLTRLGHLNCFMKCLSNAMTVVFLKPSTEPAQ